MPPRLLLLLAFFPMYQSWDLAHLHLRSGVSYHLIAECFATVAFIGILAVFARDRQRAARELAALRNAAQAAERAMAERNEAARASTRHFLREMQEQFEAWKLTASEKDVALLLIKGLSLEEIAAVRESKAKTVRQHAANVYAKAKVEGRHQLAAYFLEDLMAPQAPHGPGLKAA